MFKFVADLLFHKQLAFEEGRISLLGRPICMFPADSFAGLIKELEAQNLQNKLYYSYRGLGVTWTDTMAKNYRMTNGLDVIKWDSDIIALAGQGTVELVSMKKEVPELVFRLNKSTIAECYGKSDHAVDHLFRGLVTGAMVVVFKNESLEGVETKCVAKGDPFCEFVIKPKNLFDVSKKEVIQQIL